MYIPIEDFENYSINEEGRIINTKFNRPLAQTLTSEGYLQVQLWNNNKAKSLLVHRLVAYHFIPNPDNKPCVLHIDDDRRNCHVDNLRWGTNEENMQQRDLKINRGKISKRSIMILFKKRKWDSVEEFIREVIKS
jgi:hypothetical protein